MMITIIKGIPPIIIISNKSVTVGKRSEGTLRI